MVKSSDLENRSAASIAAAEAEIRKMRGKSPPESPLDGHPEAAERDLSELRARIEAAKALTPPRDVYDGAIWARGRDAAIAAIEAPAG